MLSVVCWKWTQVGCRSKFDASHVNVLRNMVERNYRGDWQMVCFTDDPTGIDPRVKTVRIRDVFSDLHNPVGREYPSCYRRLSAFDSDFHEYVGGRFVSVDLDCVIIKDITPLWDRTEDIVFWQSPIRAPDYNGSMWLVRTGSRPQLYKDFNPEKSPIITKQANKLGSDQGWFSFRCPGEAVWTSDRDGIYAWNPQLLNRRWLLPPNASIVFFPGIENPWHESSQRKAPWILEHYR